MGLFDRLRSGSQQPEPHEPGVFQIDDSRSRRAALTLDLGELPSDDAAISAGEEPNGAFWNGVAWYVAPDLSSRLEMDSEGSLFAVTGDRADLEQLRDRLTPLVQDPTAMAALLQQAQSDGITLEGFEGHD